MPGLSIDWLLHAGFALAAGGMIGASFYYWWSCEYKLAVVFLCYTIVNLIFMTITGTR